jgi:predicted nucleotidyltransferase
MRDIARQELIAELLALKPEFERAGVVHAALIGSRARQDNRPDSDVDLVVEVDEARRFSMLDLVGVGHIIEDNVGLPANLFMRRSLDKSFRRTTARDQVPVF